MTITDPLRLPVEIFTRLAEMQRELLIMQFSETTYGPWETLGTFNPELGAHYFRAQKENMYRLADGRVGYLRVLKVTVDFSRPTEPMSKPASDDCHTYS